MRILYLGIIIALTVLVGFFGFQAYALWVPLSTQQLLEQSKTIFVGNITAVTPVEVQYQSQIARNGTVKQSVGPETMTLDEYTVHVEEFLQNPQGYDTINLRQTTVGGVPSGPSAIGGFEVGDRVMFFLPKYENQTSFPMQYLPESFKIPQFCNGQDVLAQKRIIGSNNFTVIQNGLKVDYGNFTVDKPIKFLYDKDMNTLFGKRFDVAVGISKANDKGNLAVFSQEIHAGTKPCQWVTSAAWEFTPKEDGKYIMTIITKEGNGTGGMSQTPFYVKSDSSVINHKLPLKQFKSGTPASNVKCNDDLQLIIKAEDGSPACVKSRSAAVLILHGWARQPHNGEIVYFMKSNSTGKLTVEYNLALSHEQSVLNARIYNGSSMSQIQPSIIEAQVNPSIISGNSNTTVVYTIIPHETKGVYWLSLDACRFVPIVVDLDNSEITKTDLQPSLSGLRCPVSLLQYKIVGFEGIDPQYVGIEK